MDAQLVNVFAWVVVSSTVIYTVLLVAALVWWNPRVLCTNSPPNKPQAQLTVVIAARNEADNLGPCLQSLLDQTGVSQIRVVDDHSTDATATVVADFQARDQRIVFLAAPALPAGWLGKSHALHSGTQAIITPYLLFTDADVIFGPGIISTALHHMVTANLDHLGGHFFVDCRSVAEEICAPVLVLSSGFALFGTAQSLGAATGAFNLVRTTTYVQGGGHAPIKGEIVDDVALARHLKTAGARSEFVAMGDSVKVRLFVGFRGFVTAVARSAVPFLKLGSCIVCFLTGLCMGLVLLPLISAFGAMLIVISSPGPPKEIVTACLLGPLPYLLGFLAIRLGRRLHNGRLLFQWFYPAAIFILAASVFFAALAQLRRRPLAWRGREYAINPSHQVSQSRN